MEKRGRVGENMEEGVQKDRRAKRIWILKKKKQTNKQTKTKECQN